MSSPLQVEDNRRDPVTVLLDHRRQHQRPVPLRLPRDDQKDDLPRHRDPYETIVVLRMIDRQNPPVPPFEEILREQNQQPVNPRDGAEPAARKSPRCETSTWRICCFADSSRCPFVQLISEIDHKRPRRGQICKSRAEPLEKVIPFNPKKTKERNTSRITYKYIPVKMASDSGILNGFVPDVGQM